MSCNDEATSTERSLHAAAQSGDAGAASGADDARSLYPSIRLDQVWGLNVAPPEGAKTCVKPWHEREDTSRWTESGVDDQVSALRASSSRRHLGCWARAATDAARPA